MAMWLVMGVEFYLAYLTSPKSSLDDNACTMRDDSVGTLYRQFLVYTQLATDLKCCINTTI